MKCPACRGTGSEYVGPFFSGPCLKCCGTGEIAHVPGEGREPGNCGEGIPAGSAAPGSEPDKPAPPVKAKPKPKPRKKGKK